MATDFRLWVIYWPGHALCRADVRRTSSRHGPAPRSDIPRTAWPDQQTTFNQLSNIGEDTPLDAANSMGIGRAPEP